MGIRLETHGHVARIVLDRPEARNAINAEMAAGLDAALTSIDADPEIRAAVLSAEGPVFSAGADLKETAVTGGVGIETEHGFAGVVRHPFSKPLVAAVTGPAVAGGFELVLACDLVVAGESTTFALPEVRHGLIPGAGGLVRLVHRVGAAAASELVLTTRPMTAARLHQLGLVAELVPDDEVVARALALAEEVAAHSPFALRLAKQVLRAGEAWAANDAAVAELRSGAQFLEGPAAFAEGRDAAWVPAQGG
jgi:enoyl-CoA hydratase/carnithine racemase